MTLTLILVGTLLQVGTIGLMRRFGWPFVTLIPLVVLSQWFFLRAYNTPGTFTPVWLVSTLSMNLAACALGVYLGDRLTPYQWVGALLMIAGAMVIQVNPLSA